MGRRWRWGVPVLIAASLVLGACGDDDGEEGAAPTAPPTTGATATSAQAPEPKRGGTLTYLTIGEVSSLDAATFPLNGAGNSGPRGFPIYDALVIEDSATGEVTPRLAELSSSDSRVWTVKIRPNVKFSDGTAFDAAAVKVNWERMGDPALRSPSLFAIEQMASIDVVDPLTLRVTLKEPNGQWPRTVARQISYIGSPKAIQELGDRYGAQPVGAGPFVVKEWVRDSRLVLARNPTYWDAPRPYVDELVFRGLPDEALRYETLKTGQGDVLFTISAATGARAKSDGLEVDLVAPNGGFDIIFNTTKPPFNDVRARRAVALAIDRSDMNKVVEGGNGLVADTLFQEGSPFHDASLKLPSANLQQAQQLIDEMAREKGGPVEFTLNGSPSQRMRVEYVQAVLGRLDNLRVTVNIPANAEAVAAVFNRNYDAAVWGTNFIDPDPGLYEIVHSASAKNYLGYKNAELDRLLDVGHTSLDQKARVDAYRRVQQIVAEDVPMVYFARQRNHHIHHDDVKGFEAFTEGVPRWDLVWLDK